MKLHSKMTGEEILTTESTNGNLKLAAKNSTVDGSAFIEAKAGKVSDTNYGTEDLMQAVFPLGAPEGASWAVDAAKDEQQE